MNILTVFSVLILSFFPARHAVSHVEKNLPGADPCNLYGLVYVEPVAGFADYKVYIEDNETFADLLVFKETAPGFASDAGLWYFTDIRDYADFTISIEPVQGFADFAVYYTDFKSLAGCRK